jgi:hypothetical protein
MTTTNHSEDEMTNTAAAIKQPESTELTRIDEVTSVLAIIERMATNPAVDVDRLEKLLNMHDRVVARQASNRYRAALAEMQAELPIIERKGRIVVREKTNTGKRDGEVQQSTAYAKWEDIVQAIQPILCKHNFSLTHRTSMAADGRIQVTSILAHSVPLDPQTGHQEETSLTLPFDTTGSKNNVQAIGSAISYGKRYTGSALLGLVTHGDDDDASSAAAEIETVSEEQLAQLIARSKEVKANIPAFCKFYKIAAIADLPAAQFDDAMAIFSKKEAQEKKASKK